MNHSMVETSFAQESWDRVFELFGKSEYNILVWGPWIATTTAYWATALFFTMVDVTGWPHFVAKNKMTNVPGRQWITVFQFFESVRSILLNQLCLNWPLTQFVYYFVKYRGYEMNQELPAFTTLLFHIMGCMVIHEVSFYYVHRFTHIPFVYQHIHKQHHQYRHPVAVQGGYVHPLDYILNVIPVMLGPMIIMPHPVVGILWAALFSMHVVTVHSGYTINLTTGMDDHDDHHTYINCNFGGLGILDFLHKTDTDSYRKRMFRNYREAKKLK